MQPLDKKAGKQSAMTLMGKGEKTQDESNKSNLMEVLIYRSCFRLHFSSVCCYLGLVGRHARFCSWGLINYKVFSKILNCALCEAVNSSYKYSFSIAVKAKFICEHVWVVLLIDAKSTLQPQNKPGWKRVHSFWDISYFDGENHLFSWERAFTVSSWMSSSRLCCHLIQNTLQHFCPHRRRKTVARLCVFSH